MPKVIDKLMSDILLAKQRLKDAMRELDALLDSDEPDRRQIHNAQRKVHVCHGYYQNLMDVLQLEAEKLKGGNPCR